MDLLDDRKTAQQVVQACIIKGYGPARVRQALYEKRIPKDLWDDALADYPSQRDWIDHFLRMKINDPADVKQIKKAVDALIRRGHSYHSIKEALNELSFDSDDFPEEI